MSPTSGGGTRLSAIVRHRRSRPLQTVGAKRRVAASSHAAGVDGQGGRVKVAAETTQELHTIMQNPKVKHSCTKVRPCYGLASFVRWYEFTSRSADSDEERDFLNNPNSSLCNKCQNSNTQGASFSAWRNYQNKLRPLPSFLPIGAELSLLHISYLSFSANDTFQRGTIVPNIISARVS